MAPTIGIEMQGGALMRRRLFVLVGVVAGLIAAMLGAGITGHTESAAAACAQKGSPSVGSTLESLRQSGAHLTPAGQAVLARGTDALNTFSSTLSDTKLATNVPNVAGLQSPTSASTSAISSKTPIGTMPVDDGGANNQYSAPYFCYWGERGYVTYWTSAAPFVKSTWYYDSIQGAHKSVDHFPEPCEPFEAPCYYIGDSEPFPNWRVNMVTITVAGTGRITYEWCEGF